MDLLEAFQRVLIERTYTLAEDAGAREATMRAWASETAQALVAAVDQHVRDLDASHRALTTARDENAQMFAQVRAERDALRARYGRLLSRMHQSAADECRELARAINEENGF